MSLNLKSETIWISIIFLSVAIGFAGSLRGDFVYDDRRQIVGNPLIQNSQLYGKALTSDVWAFKGDGTVAASNYWRPVFTAWCILNFSLFGLDPFGWHLLNLLLHAGVCILAYLLLRRWNISQKVALAIAIIFAVHPVHTESVVWISGSSDILLSFFLLLALYFADMASIDAVHRNRNIAIAVVFYLLALGSKEVAVFCAPLLILVMRSRDNDSSKRFGLSAPLLFVGAAAAYLAVRWLVLGNVTHPVADYLRQIVWPVTLAPNYPLRPVESADLWNFVVPSVVALLALGAGFAVSRGSFIRRTGFALFLLSLLPAFFLTVFMSDQIVHDRYLYLPMLGFLIVVVTWLTDRIEKITGRDKAELLVVGASLAVSVVLCLQTISYRRVWLSELALWSHSVTIDESSASNWLQLGAELAVQNDLEASKNAYARSLAIKQDPLAMMGNSRVAIALGDADAAIRDLEFVIAIPAKDINAYTLLQSYETLAVAYQQKKNNEMAERRLREARDRLPIYGASLTEKLAVVLYLQNRKPEALTELESARSQARREMLPASKLVIFRLGMLYSELGRRNEARAAFEEYLALTRNEAAASQERQQAAQMLQSLR
jgi:Flp pilus assembly protein TadD